MGKICLTPALIGEREGSECIYKESMLICVARIHSIKADDRCIDVELVPLPVPGLNTPKDAWTSGSVWEVFSCDAESWTSACSGLVWRIFFDAALIREIKELGPTFSEKESEWDRFEKLIRCINACEVRHLKTQQSKR